MLRCATLLSACAQKRERMGMSQKVGEAIMAKRPRTKDAPSLALCGALPSVAQGRGYFF